MTRYRDVSIAASIVVAAACGSNRPPADFAPDPGLLTQIRELRMVTPPSACPGQALAATYSAIMNDGTAIPFATRYDRDRPPRLHVMFLERSSPEADALEGGAWLTPRDPLIGAETGYRLRAVLTYKPDLEVRETVPPDYACLPHAFSFSGRTGGTGGEPGGDGPDVTVRLALARSPFYERLIVAAVEVGEAPPFFVLADAAAVPPREWLVLKSSGGRGGSGRTGRNGAKGADGTAGCPGSAGATGGDAEAGDDGGTGGRGGRITIIAPTEDPFLSGLVDAQTPGGEAGAAGRGGAGGAGGKGGAASRDGCAAGPDGTPGRAGAAGRVGREGTAGPRPRVITVAAKDVFGQNLPPELAALLRRVR